ncbi:unnamed protein product [Onchocerca flexuosa]|uniref:LITAF domain-containing protein n=1 Tax=Onchocerca flexuosa TaxID=387005 RepID=A0A183HCU9_9BILA|nr:unnamed protein product [Onchocerca flexuosa]
MCCICRFLFGDKKPKTCQTCGEKVLTIRTFTALFLCSKFCDEKVNPVVNGKQKCRLNELLEDDYAIQAVEMRFTKLGSLLCIGGSLYCCVGLCCLLLVTFIISFSLLRERHCPFCYRKSFEEIARVRRRIQCLVDDKSEMYVFIGLICEIKLNSIYFTFKFHLNNMISF